MRKIRLTDGSEYQVDRCGTMNDLLLIRVIEGTIVTLVPVFGDPVKTARIEHYFDGTETDHVVFEGYTNLKTVSEDETGILIYLKRRGD